MLVASPMPRPIRSGPGASGEAVAGEFPTVSVPVQYQIRCPGMGLSDHRTRRAPGAHRQQRGGPVPW